MLSAQGKHCCDVLKLQVRLRKPRLLLVPLEKVQWAHESIPAATAQEAVAFTLAVDDAADPSDHSVLWYGARSTQDTYDPANKHCSHTYEECGEHEPTTIHFGFRL